MLLGQHLGSSKAAIFAQGVKIQSALGGHLYIGGDTYSSPWFIHQSQAQRLGAKAEELEALCGRQGGTWRYMGLSEAAGRSGHPGSPLGTVGHSVPIAGVADEQSLRGELAAMEAEQQQELARQILRQMVKRRDALVVDALSYAARQKWIGRFACQRNSAGWSSSINYERFAARKERYGLEYRDITLEVRFFAGEARAPGD